MEDRVISGLPEQIKVSERKRGGDLTNWNKLGPLCLKLSSRMQGDFDESKFSLSSSAPRFHSALLEKSKQADRRPMPQLQIFVSLHLKMILQVKDLGNWFIYLALRNLGCCQHSLKDQCVRLLVVRKYIASLWN